MNQTLVNEIQAIINETLGMMDDMDAKGLCVLKYYGALVYKTAQMKLDELEAINYGA